MSALGGNADIPILRRSVLTRQVLNIRQEGRIHLGAAQQFFRHGQRLVVFLVRRDVRLRSGLLHRLLGMIGHQLYKEFGASKLDGVDFQSVPTDEAQDAGYGFWRLDAARAAQEQTQASGQNADAKNEDGEMDLRKREFPLFLPDVDDRGDKAGQEAYLARVPCHRVRGRC